MMKNIRRWALAAIALLPMMMTAAPVDSQAAQTLAQRFMLSTGSSTLKRAPVAPMTLVEARPSAARAQCFDYYVFNANDGSAFAIVSGDDRAEAILAYGDGVIEMNNLPCNLHWMLDSYAEQMEYLHANPAAQVELAIPYNDVTIPPLLTCNWGQSEPFYNQCPVFQGKRSVTGCVATAMAQVMYYWRYPNSLPAVNGYYTRSNRTYLQGLPAKALDWDNMINDYAATPYVSAQADAVATLMRYCGQAVRMDYSPDGSGAYVGDQLSAMKNFGYNPGAQELRKANYSYDEWDVLLQEELQAGRPVLYSGNDPAAGGHAFVVDGYYDGKYHVNWGWNGSYNGYFALGAFNVRNYKFLASQEILYHVYPPTQPETHNLYDFEADGIYYSYGDRSGEVCVAGKDTHYGSYSGQVTVPAQVTCDGVTMTVTAIADDAFRNCVDLTEVSLPSTLTSIGNLAFFNCVNLECMEVPEGVTAIGQLAFASCLNMTSVSLPSSLQRIDARAFVECDRLTDVRTPDAQAWANIAFADRTSNPLSFAHHLMVGDSELEHLVIPGSCGAVGKNAFIDCTGLKSVVIEDGVTEIGTSAFANCTGLTTLTLPAQMQELESQAFIGCSSLEAVNLPEGIEQLSSGLFSGCSSLAQLTFPSTLTAIGADALSGCSSLTQALIPDGVTTIGSNAFKSCTSLRRLVLPPSVSTIGVSAFQSCSSLTTVTIPDAVSVIEDQTFFHCYRLSRLVLGKGLTKINLKAFGDCSKLVSVTCCGDVPADMANPDCFLRAIYETARLYVPVDTRSVYKRSGVWPWFKNMIGITIGLQDYDVNGDGEVNIADVDAVITTILTTDDNPFSDVNDDKEANISDVDAIITVILNP